MLRSIQPLFFIVLVLVSSLFSTISGSSIHIQNIGSNCVHNYKSIRIDNTIQKRIISSLNEENNYKESSISHSHSHNSNKRNFEIKSQIKKLNAKFLFIRGGEQRHISAVDIDINNNQRTTLSREEEEEERKESQLNSEESKRVYKVAIIGSGNLSFSFIPSGILTPQRVLLPFLYSLAAWPDK